MLSFSPKSSGGDPKIGVPLITVGAYIPLCMSDALQYITRHFEEPGDSYINEIRELHQLREVRRHPGSSCVEVAECRWCKQPRGPVTIPSHCAMQLILNAPPDESGAAAMRRSALLPCPHSATLMLPQLCVPDHGAVSTHHIQCLDRERASVCVGKLVHRGDEEQPVAGV